jgi:hypothetical protein
VKRVLIVAPHFAPVNAPDGQRVRMSLPYYPEFGWDPVVLTVRPDAQPEPRDDSLLDTLPAASIVEVGAVPERWTRPLGIGNVALRAWPSLYRTGLRLIRERRIDATFFSTTMVMSMPLGRLWKRRCGVPYILDLQDPWFTTYYDDKPAAERPPKHRLVRAVHRRLEAWTMGAVDQVISVSDAYTDDLRRRYPWITPAMCTTIPFGASVRDAELADARAMGPARVPGPPWQGVYVGRAGGAMAHAARVLFGGLARHLAVPGSAPVTLSFVGTEYATGGRARESVRPLALAAGVGDRVTESVEREPFLNALARLRRADFLLVLGSDDPQYTASKIFPYVLARRPILAVVHERSPLVSVIRQTRCGEVVTFNGRDDTDGPSREVAAALMMLTRRLPYEPPTDWAAVEPYLSANLTRLQCRVFDAAATARTVGVPLPCAG